LIVINYSFIQNCHFLTTMFGWSGRLLMKNVWIRVQWLWPHTSRSAMLLTPVLWF